MWIWRFCSYFRHYFFHHFNTPYHDSLCIHIIPTTSLHIISSSQPHPTLNPLPIVMDHLEVHVTVLSTDLRHPLLVEEQPARRLYPGQLIGLLFPQETARITATVRRLVGTD